METFYGVDELKDWLRRHNGKRHKSVRVSSDMRTDWVVRELRQAREGESSNRLIQTGRAGLKIQRAGTGRNEWAELIQGYVQSSTFLNTQLRPIGAY